MIDGLDVGRIEERAHLIGAHGGTLAILSQPSRVPLRQPAAILLNAGLLHRIGPYRLYVSIARRLAALGFPAVRLDVAGKGDSVRPRTGTYAEAVAADVGSAIELLRDALGVERVVLIGLCSGADDALAAAPAHAAVAGLVLLDGYAQRTRGYWLRHYGARLLARRAWAGAGRRAFHRVRRFVADEELEMTARREFDPPDAVRARFASLAARGTEFLCIFTSGAHSYYNARGQLVHGLKLPGLARLTTELHWPAAKQTYPLAVHRDAVIETIAGWFGRRFAAPGASDAATLMSSGSQSVKRVRTYRETAEQP
jgi:pimeloyl-ACP methyl ester carboxylesterase